MHIVVVGGGVIGLTTAYYLRRSGVEVTLLEQNRQPAQGASFATAGSMTASRAGPWASPKALAKTLKGYFDSDSAFKLRLEPNFQQAHWLLGFLRSAYSHHASAKRAAMVTLARESIAERRMLDKELGLDYGGVYPGLLTIYEKTEDFDAAARDAEYLKGLGIDVRLLSPSDCEALEPTVAWGSLQTVGATLAPDDETADCYRFCRALDAVNASLGVVRRYGEQVTRLDARKLGQCVVRTDASDLTADGVVIAAGVQSVGLARTQGIRLPIYPVKGYSLNVPLERELLPRHTLSHERRKVFVSPSAVGLRAAGVADIVGYNTALDNERVGLVRRTIADLFPRAALSEGVEQRSGLRPMTYDGPPVICGVLGTGLWLNTGHGSLGWTLSLGAAKLTSELVTSGRYAPDNAYFGMGYR